MDETTVAPPAYDENDIITHIFCLDRCFTWVQQAMPVGVLGACRRAGRLGEKCQHGLYRHFSPLIFSLFCSTAQQISFESNNYGRFQGHNEENVCTSAEFSCVYLPSSVRFQIHIWCWSASLLNKSHDAERRRTSRDGTSLG